MQICIDFPAVQKMIFFTQLQISEEDSFLDVQQKIFTVFWDTMGKFISIHGSPDQAVLRTPDRLIIKNMEMLKQYQSERLEVMFAGPHH